MPRRLPRMFAAALAAFDWWLSDRIVYGPTLLVACAALKLSPLVDRLMPRAFIRWRDGSASARWRASRLSAV